MIDGVILKSPSLRIASTSPSTVCTSATKSHREPYFAASFGRFWADVGDFGATWQLERVQNGVLDQGNQVEGGRTAEAKISSTLMGVGI